MKPPPSHPPAVARDGQSLAGHPLLAVVLEDYFQVASAQSVVSTERWYRFETRVEINTLKALDLLDQYGIKATFFVLGWIADEIPELVREVARRGHEVASKGYYHRRLRQFDRASFREDVRRAHHALERASGSRVAGYRIAHGWLGPEDVWALDVLAEEGYAYDASFRPIFRAFAEQPARRFAHQHQSGEHSIWELPVPSWSLGGWSLPIGGGNYLRQFPRWLMQRLIDRWLRTHEAPFVLYFHVWELDPEQPRIDAAPLRQRIRQYRNLEKMPELIRGYLERYPFGSIGEYLSLARPAPEALSPPPPGTRHYVAGTGGRISLRTRPLTPEEMAASAQATPVTVVVPCYNEALVLPYLANTLRHVQTTLLGRYGLRFVFVDDGSSDATWPALHKLFGARPHCTLVQHGKNRGVAAAILTGIRSANTEIVCSIDCDCTYDPHQLEALIPLLEEGVDVVTASPYHAEGKVLYVPTWRLFLSKGLSFLYRRVLRQNLATYTSCFRVYRREAVAGLETREQGFLGVAEMLGMLDLQGRRIVECPAVLEVRHLGRSKMKTLRTIAGHLKLLTRLALARLTGRGARPGAGAAQRIADEAVDERRAAP